MDLIIGAIVIIVIVAAAYTVVVLADLFLSKDEGGYPK